MPSGLEALQRRFVAAIVEGDEAFAAEVTGGGKLTPAGAVGVYRRAYPARLTEALGETFERVWRVLGDEDFFATCAAFVPTRRSASYNLSDYGRDFPEFLESRAELAHAPFLGDLARLEWTFKELFHAADNAGLPAAELARSASSGCRLVFGEATALLALGHRVHAIWRRDLADDSPLEPEVWRGREDLFLHKKDGLVYSRPLTPSEAAALAALRAGRPLDEALAGAEGLDAGTVSSLFHDLAESGAVIAVRT
ncbi:MAG: DNA-binding domain-containing protein [Elusimicrobiota bacterium]|nr:DNA-binding domain-containing protein [Elusimicrobiota bacterium]